MPWFFLAAAFAGVLLHHGLAIDAFQNWGKGRTKAGLNFGDCFSYALAMSQSVPLLFIGRDFSQTDIERA